MRFLVLLMAFLHLPGLSGSPDTPLFGVLQNTSPHLDAYREAGLNCAILELEWSNFYLRDGVKNTDYISAKKEELRELRDHGFAVMLGFGTQYPPAWIHDTPHSRFINQYGDAYRGGVGETGVNAVFNEELRKKQAVFVREVFGEFGRDFIMVRLGFMRYGEIGFPHPEFNGNSNSYWAFDDIAQGKVEGLPDGIPPCPVPGWIPGTPSEDHRDAEQFLTWYFDALRNYHDWQIDLVSQEYHGKMAMLYPSWGLRGSKADQAVKGDLDGSTSAEKNGEIQRGFDFKGMVEGITNEHVVVYCTWIDSNPAWSDDDSPHPENPSPVHYLTTLAQNHPLKLSVMGENTGGGGMAAMQLTFDRMKRYNLQGLMWAFESDLQDNEPPTLSDYADFIHQYTSKKNTGMDDRRKTE